MSDEGDAVHLTGAGYLTAGRVIRVGQAVASVLANWDPDSPDGLTEGPIAVGPPRGWSLDGSADMWEAHEQRLPRGGVVSSFRAGVIGQAERLLPRGAPDDRLQFRSTSIATLVAS